MYSAKIFSRSAARLRLALTSIPSASRRQGISTSSSGSQVIVEEPYFSDYYLVDGTEVIEAADGTVTFIDPDGSWSSSYADGSWEYYDSVTGESGGGMIYD